MIKTSKILKPLLLLSMILGLTLASIAPVIPATTSEEAVLQPITITSPAQGYIHFGYSGNLRIPFGLTIIIGTCPQLWVSAAANVDWVDWYLTDFSGNQIHYIGAGTQPPKFHQNHQTAHWPTGSLPVRCVLKADAYHGFWPNTVYLGSAQIAIWKFF